MDEAKDVLRIQLRVSRFAYPEIFDILAEVGPYYKSKRLMQLALDGLNARRSLIPIQHVPCLTLVQASASMNKEETVAVKELGYSEIHYKISVSSAAAICSMLDEI